MNKKIGIRAWGSVSPLGVTRASVEMAYFDQRIYLQKGKAGDWEGSLPFTPAPVGELGQKSFFREDIDRSVLLSLLAADQCRQTLDWQLSEEPIGINIGSSRGATNIWERHYRQFTSRPSESISPLTSPTTTLGNISSWLGIYLAVEGPVISHSVTCSSALEAIANGVAWLESGRCRKFLAGGSEAPLTPFTFAQMKALRIYASPDPADYPCRSLEEHKKINSMVLGEGAALFALEADAEEAAAYIRGMGFSQEIPHSPTGISREGQALQRAMRQALEEFGQDRVDVVVCHAPGTRQGDAAERRAIRAVFGDRLPMLSGNKWKIGHTLGPSGALSLEMAILMLQHNRFFPIPYLPGEERLAEDIESIMINAMGFGGNAISIIISR